MYGTLYDLRGSKNIPSGWDKPTSLTIIENADIPNVKQITVSNKTKPMYSAILFIIHFYRNIRSNAFPSVVSISCSGELTRYISKSSLGVYINEMRRIGILRVHSYTYRFKSEKSNRSYSKQYIWFPSNEAVIKKQLEEQGVKMLNIEEKELKANLADLINTNLIRWTSTTKIIRPQGMTPSDMEIFIRKVLREKYPELASHQHLVSLINANYYKDYPERVITYQPHLSFSAKNAAITAIGIRYNCDFCSYSKIKTRQNDTENRPDYLKRNNLNLVYDVKGSVPRVSRLINFGVWENAEYDPYKEIWWEYGRICKDTPFWDDEARTNSKEMFMDCYFDITVESMVNHTFRVFKRNGEDKKWTRKAVRELYTDYLQAVESVCGKSIGSEIFFHESNIYIEVLKTMLEDGFDCVTCYDCFYASKKGVTQDEFEKYMDNLVTKTALGYVSALKSTAGR